MVLRFSLCCVITKRLASLSGQHLPPIQSPVSQADGCGVAVGRHIEGGDLVSGSALLHDQGMVEADRGRRDRPAEQEGGEHQPGQGAQAHPPRPQKARPSIHSALPSPTADSKAAELGKVIGPKSFLYCCDTYHYLEGRGVVTDQSTRRLVGRGLFRAS